MTAEETINKILWDPSWAEGCYEIGIYDRFKETIISHGSSGAATLRVGWPSDAGSSRFFIDLIVNGVVTQVPQHRLRWIKRNGEIVWSR